MKPSVTIIGKYQDEQRISYFIPYRENFLRFTIKKANMSADFLAADVTLAICDKNEPNDFIVTNSFDAESYHALCDRLRNCMDRGVTEKEYLSAATDLVEACRSVIRSAERNISRA